jgi:hypothetical protein
MGPGELPIHKLSGGLKLLLEAYDWSHASQLDTRQFAVKASSLCAAGLSETQILWLVWNLYAEHLFECTPPADRERSFRELGHSTLRRRSCLVLTDAGAEFTRPICRQIDDRPNVSKDSELAAAPANGRSPAVDSAGKPRWNSNAFELTFDGEIVLKFTRVAPNEEPILDEFERQGWAPRIMVPTYFKEGTNRKARLHNAVKTLNRKQRVKRIQFSTAGAGRSLCWSPVARPSLAATNSDGKRRGSARQSKRRA